MKTRHQIAALAAAGIIVLGAVTLSSGSSSLPFSATDEAGRSAGGAFDGDLGLAIEKAMGGDSFAAYAPVPDFAPAPPRTGGAGETANFSTSSSAADSSRAGAPPLATSGQAGAGGATTDGSSTLSSTSDRKIVQTGTIRLQVNEVGGSFEEVGRIASSVGGFVASSNFSLQGEQQIAAVTIRVPAESYQSVLSQVRVLGEKIDSEASNASDVTEEYTDLSARLRTYEATEMQLLEFLGQTKTIAEVLQVQDRLNTTRTSIEQVKGRMAMLDKLTDLATLTVHLRPVAASVSNGSGTGVDLGAEISEAWDESLEFLTSVAAGVISVVVFAWWVPIVAIPTLLVAGRAMRSRPRGPEPARSYD